MKRYLAVETLIGKRKAAPRPQAKRGDVRARLSEVLEQSKDWAQGKQRPTAARLHQMLRAAGLDVGYMLVKEELREWKRQRREVLVPFVYKPGDLGEVDFFEV